MLITPLVVAVVCSPLQYLIENRRIVSGLERAGVASYTIGSSGRLAESIGDTVELLFNYQAATHLRTKLGTVVVNSSEVNEDALAAIPTEHLETVWVGATAKAPLTKRVISWLNGLPDSCDLTISFYGHAGESLSLAEYLDRDVKSLVVSEQELSQKVLHSFLNFTPHELSLSGIGLVSNDILVGVPIRNLELLRIRNCSFAEGSFEALLKATNPRTLLVNGLGPVTQHEFKSVFELECLEGLSIAVPWLTARHLESLSYSQTLRWVSTPKTAMPEEELARLRATVPEIKINGKTGHDG